MKRILTLSLLFLVVAAPATAKIDLVFTPGKENTELTVYRSTDLTLVREHRTLTLTSGLNRLQFDWSNTQIDPTSVRLKIKPGPAAARVRDLSYPPGSSRELVWEVMAEEAGTVPVEINYFTLGLNWEASYKGLLENDENRMRLKGFVRLENKTGETFRNAKTRLLMGKINVLEELSEVIKKWTRKKTGKRARVEQERKKRRAAYSRGRGAIAQAEAAPVERKQVESEALSEYYLFTVEGRETLEDGWGRRLQFLAAEEVPLESIYRYHPDRYGENVVRFLEFSNDTAAGLGEQPLPAGPVDLVKKSSRTFLEGIGRAELEYLPRFESARLKLGDASRVQVASTLMDRSSKNHTRDDEGNLTGWDELKTRELECRNFRSRPVRLEIFREFPHQFWQLVSNSHEFSRVSSRRIKFILQLPAKEREVINYKVEFPRGVRRD